eukprot:1493016-Amphidinium_carterae.1
MMHLAPPLKHQATPLGFRNRRRTKYEQEALLKQGRSDAKKSNDRTMEAPSRWGGSTQLVTSSKVNDGFSLPVERADEEVPSLPWWA